MNVVSGIYHKADGLEGRRLARQTNVRSCCSFTHTAKLRKELSPCGLAECNSRGRAGKLSLPLPTQLWLKLVSL